MYTKLVSVELECEHPKFTRDELDNVRSMLSNKYDSKIPNFKVVLDYSLFNGGLEITSKLVLRRYKSLLDDLNKLGFVFSVRCGVHIHINVYELRYLDELKTMIRNMYLLQTNRDKVLYRHVGPYKQVIPISVLLRLLSDNVTSIRRFAELYLNELTGYKITNVKERLKRKGPEHTYWIDLSPLLRKLLKVDTNRKKPVGSIEIRGAARRHIKEIPVSYDRFRNTVKDLLYLGKRVLKGVGSSKYI